MTKEIENRKGARKAQDIPQHVLELLNKGEIQTVNLTEWLAIDHLQLIQNVFPGLGATPANITTICDAIQTQKKPSTMNTTKLVGSLLHRLYDDPEQRALLFQQLSSHPSDSIRCYAPYLIALDEKLSIEHKLAASQPLVADNHFGVREVIWMALRPSIEQHLQQAIALLTTWAENDDENIRRFTTESTRPRGVWCKHIEILTEQPELALPILEKLRADPSKYVQDSVGNWLNDASKSREEFVADLCDQWQKESASKETEKIIKRAMRTIDKKKKPTSKK